MAVTSGRGVRPKRPLSPHLQIYSPLINMVMSIVHRITGAALYFGSLLLAWWLIAAASGPDAYNYFLSWCDTWFGKLVLLGYTWVLMHHMMGGIRHFIWDSGHGYDLETVDLLSWGSLAASLALTAIVWIAVAMGGRLMTTMRTPLKKVRYLGSAKEGADHFWKQRVTAVANLFLGIFLVWLIVSLLGADYATAKQKLAHPLIAIPLLGLVLSGTVHMRIGMQVIIEDYVHEEGLKVVALMLNTFFAIAIALACVFSILKLSFGA